jgi:acyl-CoA synthetase (AMP-forming)/AMP-acid ligase II
MSAGTTTWPPRCDDEQLMADFAVELRPGESPGHNVMEAYWSLPEATADAVVSEWFPTGDIGPESMRAFYIVARKKN